MKLLTLSLTLLLTLTTLHAEKFDPRIYETNMTSLYTKVQARDAENLRLCKIFAEHGKEYKALNKGDKFYTQTVANCERRVKLYCGALHKSKLAENNTSK